MSTKPVIAILGDIPVWLIKKNLPQPAGHYAVWLIALAEALSEASSRFDLHWISFCKGIAVGREFEYAGQHFHVLPGGSLTLAQKTHYMWDRWRVRRILRRLRPDIVHAWGTESRYAVCGAEAACKKLLSMQGILTAYHERSPLGAHLSRQARTEKALLPRFELVTSESLWGCEMCRQIAPSARIVRWEYAAEERFFEKERFPQETPMCLMAGTDTPIKNVETAIRAFSLPELAHVELFLAGVSREKHPDLPPNIHALGRVSRERMVELLQASWALVHPSLADTSPNIVKEARVMGVPVVTSRDCGGAQYVEEGKSGYVIPAKDAEALTRAVLAMTQDRNTSLGMGEWGRAECRRLLSRETMVKRLLEIYAALLQNNENSLS